MANDWDIIEVLPASGLPETAGDIAPRAVKRPEAGGLDDWSIVGVPDHVPRGPKDGIRASIGKEAVATTMTMPRTIAGGQVQALGEAFGGNEPTGAKLKEREIAAIHAQYRQASQGLASLPEGARQPQAGRSE